MAEDALRPDHRPRLGRGLAALLGDASDDSAVMARARGTRKAPIEFLRPNPRNPRKRFDDVELDDLAASIKERGVIQPVIVRPHPEKTGRYQLVAGERRWRAAQRARLHEIPALVRELADREVMALALIENLQREDLNPIEEARAYQRLADGEGLSQAEIARMVDKSRSHIANLQRLLALPEGVIAMVEAGELSMGHARALIGAENAEQLARQAAAKGLSVRQVEALMRRGNGAGAPRKQAAPAPASADILAVQAHLEEFLGLPVRIATDANPQSGAVTIRYRTLDQLDLICQRLTGGSI